MPLNVFISCGEKMLMSREFMIRSTSAGEPPSARPKKDRSALFSSGFFARGRCSVGGRRGARRSLAAFGGVDRGVDLSLTPLQRSTCALRHAGT